MIKLGDETKFGDEYVLAPGRGGNDRLRVLGELHDPSTRALLQRSGGLSPATRYVEFGCGLGSVARWVAPRVAHVTAVDLSAERLVESERLAAEAGVDVEFRIGSVYDHGLPPESFDVSYSRWLLVHLSRPVDGLRSVFDALAPGGLLVCEEVDISVIGCEPRSAAYDTFRDLGLEYARERHLDYEGGRRLHLWARDAGFEVLHVAAYQPHFIKGPFKGFWNQSFLESGPRFVEAGLLTEERLAELAEGMQAADDDPDTVVGHARTHQLIARRPM